MHFRAFSCIFSDFIPIGFVKPNILVDVACYSAPYVSFVKKRWTDGRGNEWLVAIVCVGVGVGVGVHSLNWPFVIINVCDVDDRLRRRRRRRRNDHL